mgnify:CR=1 FL=1
MRLFASSIFFLFLSINSFATGRIGLGFKSNLEKIILWDNNNERGLLTYEKDGIYPTFLKFGLSASINSKKTSLVIGVSYFKENYLQFSYMTGCARCFAGSRNLYYRNLSFPISGIFSFSDNYNSTVFGELGFEIINTLYFRKDTTYAMEKRTYISKKIALNRIPFYYGLGYKCKIQDDFYFLTGLNTDFGTIIINSELNEIQFYRLRFWFELRKEF